jgi:hypothetical protein
MKIKKCLFQIFLSSLPIVVAPISISSCSSTTSDEKEIAKCNYTVKAIQERNVNEPQFYIGSDIKGYISGKLYIEISTQSSTCFIYNDTQTFVGKNVYIPK